MEWGGNMIAAEREDGCHRCVFLSQGGRRLLLWGMVLPVERWGAQ